jgi:tetratricopeptide (TPR) repeat protein
MASKTCFVISPIGEEGSEARQAADDLFELILNPSLSRFDFSVVRADRIPGSGVITTEVIDLVQGAELCVMDLSGHNANVFYECGRRHENGKPFVQMIAKGERIPFDLAGIRTIFFDLVSPRTVRQAADELERYVEEFEAEGYPSVSSGASLSSLSTALHRLENKLDRAIGLSGGGVPQELSRPVAGGIRSLLKNPQMAMMEALHAGNVAEASAALQRMKAMSGPAAEAVVLGAGLLASAGDATAHHTLMQALDEAGDSLEPEMLKASISSATQYYLMTDRESDGSAELLPLIDRLLEEVKLPAADRASILNQKERLLYGAGEYQDALVVAKQVVELEQEEPAYWYNLSGVCEAVEDFQAAADAIDRCLTVLPDDGGDPSHLAQAVEVYVKVGRVDEAQRAFARLQSVSEIRAAIVAEDEAVQSALAGR